MYLRIYIPSLSSLTPLPIRIIAMDKRNPFNWSSPLYGLLFSLLPSFFSSPDTYSRKTTPTTYLNGLRGIAALAVLNQHHLARWYPEVLHGWQSRPESDLYIQMPLLRIIYAGHFMVKIFFILSGYVLSYGPLKLIRKKDYYQLHHSLASGTFRRGLRLYLPTVVPFIIATWLSYMDAYSYGKALKPTSVPNIQPTLWLAYRQMCTVVVKMLNPFQNKEFYPRPMLAHLWTLPVEFRGSMTVFILLLTLGKVTVRCRIILISGFALFCIMVLRWETFLFAVGIILAELGLIRESESCRPASLDGISPCTTKALRFRYRKGAFWIVIFVFAIHLGCWPNLGTGSTPGYVMLQTLTPEWYNAEGPKYVQIFWNTIGAVLLLLALENCEILRKPFMTNFALWLGDVSFSLYIVHWTLVFTLGQNVTVMFINVTGHFDVGFFLGAVVLYGVVFWVSDVYTRVGDNRCVEYARLIKDKCFDSS